MFCALYTLCTLVLVPTQPPYQLVQEVKRPGLEYNSTSYNAEVSNGWSCASTPSLCRNDF